MQTTCYEYCSMSTCSGSRWYTKYHKCTTYDSNGDYMYEKTYNKGCDCYI